MSESLCVQLKGVKLYNVGRFNIRHLRGGLPKAAKRVRRYRVLSGASLMG